MAIREISWEISRIRNRIHLQKYTRMYKSWHHCSLTLWGVLLLSLSEVSKGSYSYHILSIYELVYCSKLVFSLHHLVSTTEQKCQLIWHYSNYWPACCCWAALKCYVQLFNERMYSTNMYNVLNLYYNLVSHGLVF